jgi:hypothetical protein
MRPSPAFDRALAAVGLALNVAALPALGVWISADAPLASATLAVGLAAILPALVLGVIASSALLARRRWGRVLAIVALALSLAVSLSYGVVWLSLVPFARPLMATGIGLLVLFQTLALIYWCLPRPWR